MDRTPVESSNIQSIGYDPATRVLEVEFGKAELEDPTNRIYIYRDVPRDVYEALMDDRSHGGYLNEHIAANYAYQRLGVRGEFEPTD
jgi:hypothetical protein